MDFQELESKWQEKWANSKIFEVSPNKNKSKFFMSIPYPYISGSLHIGHARVVTEADVFTRFQQMNGKNALFPLAFHISGTPVLGISLAIKNGDQKKIELYKRYVKRYVPDETKANKIIKSFEDPQKIVDFFIPKMEEEFKTLGLGVDWRRSFTSGDDEHQALVEWQFKKYKEKGYLVQGEYPILFSKTLNNAVGEDDIIDGDINSVDIQEFTLIKFKFEDSYLMAGTLRPETMFGQTNMWANPNLTYVKIEVGKEKWIVSKECAEKLTYQNKKINIIGEIKGTDLIGKKCFAPFVERDIPILPSLHCDANISTGLVTSVPGDAPFDYIALKELQEDEKTCKKYKLDFKEVKSIKLIPIIKSKGYGDFPAVEICKKMKITSLDQHAELEEATQEIYKTGFHTGVMTDTCGEYSGQNVTKAKEGMKEKLLDANNAEIFYEVSRPAQSRDGGEVIVAIIDKQWFLDFNAKGWKKLANKSLEATELWPEKYRKQMTDVFDWLDKRPCARKRGLGTQLPFDKNWVIESLSDSTLYMSLYPIIHIIRKNKITKDQLTSEFFDFVFNSEGNVEDVSKNLEISVELLEELTHEWNYWYPCDQRHTFSAHLSNHLSFMIFAHAACLKEDKWPKRISYHGFVMRDGEKMSKSKGNIITLMDIKEQFGADSFRAFMCNNTSVENTFDWNSDKVLNMKKHLTTLFELIKEMQTNREGTDEYKKFKSFISKIQRMIVKATDFLEKMNLREYSNVILYEIPTSYRKIKNIANDSELRSLNAFLGDIWIKMLTPLVPHMAEELWHLSEENFVSLTSWPKENVELIDEHAEYEEELHDKLRKDILTVLELAKIKTPKKIELFISKDWKYDFVSFMKEQYQKTKNAKEIIGKIMQTDLRKQGKEVMKLIPAMLKDTSKIPTILKTKEEELASLEEMKELLVKEFGAKIVIIDAEKSDDSKARNAFPGKPAIKIE